MSAYCPGTHLRGTMTDLLLGISHGGSVSATAHKTESRIRALKFTVAAMYSPHATVFRRSGSHSLSLDPKMDFP